MFNVFKVFRNPSMYFSFEHVFMIFCSDIEDTVFIWLVSKINDTFWIERYLMNA